MTDDISAYKVTYTDNNNDKEVQVMKVWTVITKDNFDKDDLEDHVNKAYSIWCESMPIEFPIYLNTANNTKVHLNLAK